MIPVPRRRLERVLRGRLDPADDTGATLVLALIVITVVALVVSAMLSFSDTSIRVTLAVRSQAATTYAGDGAAQAAITALRRSPYNNDPSSATYPKCFGTTDTLALPNFYPSSTGGAATSAAVKCSPDPDTGAAGGLVEINPDNRPGNAILTTGQNPAEDGLNIVANSSTIPFTVHGSVVSNSNIRVTPNKGSLLSNTAVLAHTGCAGTIVSTPAANCAAGTLPTPDYPAETSVVPTYRSVPTSCPGKLMTFLPGYYDDAQALSSVMAGNGSCKGSVWWFTPGTYYFDFHNSSNPLTSGGSDLWLIKDGQLIGGTPVNAAGAVISKPAVPSTVPGACENPLKDATEGRGVQFIFGGDSRMQVAGSADVELCANYHAHQRMIAVYGVRSGDDIPTTSTAKPGSVTSQDAVYGGTVTAAGLATVDSAGATWNKTSQNSQTGTFTVGGFAPAPAIPAGSVLTGATLKVVYKNSGGVTGDSRTVALTPAGGTAINATLPITSGSAFQTAQMDVYTGYGGATGSLATAVYKGFTGASLSYSAKLAHSGVETIDAIQLDLTYRPPAFRAEDTAVPGGNCLTSTYTGGSAGQCAVLSTTTSYAGAFYIQGTTFVPSAVIDLALNNITSQVLRFGVIARSLWVKETGSITYSGPVIEVPENSPGFGPGGTVVYLDVYLCEASATCSTATGQLSLRVRVLIYDPSGSPSPPARQMTIQSWSVQR